MNYRNSLKYLDSFTNYEKKTDYSYTEDLTLERVRSFLALLGSPEKRINTVLVAGTNGKGATANFLADIFKCAGYRAGLYTSPHLTDVRERITINGEWIPERDFARILGKIEKSLRQEKVQPTYFEVLTAAAFLYFEKERVDIAVLEVGMGGRLDATNVAAPLLSIITPVGLDHQDQLGNTLAEIAREKGGIIHPGVPVVSARQEKEAGDILKEIAAERGLKIYFAGEDFKCDAQGFQEENATLALFSADLLKECFSGLNEEAKREGIKTALWPGRFEVVEKGKRTFVFDGAHNVQATRKFVHEVSGKFLGKKKTVVLGVSRNKDIDGVLREFSGLDDADFIVTEGQNPRLMSSDELYMKAKACLKRVREEKSLRNAVLSGPEDGITIITGSLYLVGEARGMVIGPGRKSFCHPRTDYHFFKLN